MIIRPDVHDAVGRTQCLEATLIRAVAVQCNFLISMSERETFFAYDVRSCVIGLTAWFQYGETSLLETNFIRNRLIEREEGDYSHCLQIPCLLKNLNHHMIDDCKQSSDNTCSHSCKNIIKHNAENIFPFICPPNGSGFKYVKYTKHDKSHNPARP